MKNTFITIFFILFSSNLIPQFGIIKDIDGYTNVRKEPNKNSEILYKLTENEIFSYNYEKSKTEIKTGWIEIYIPKNKFSLGCNEDENSILGYIHESRLQPIENLPLYKGKEFSFKYDLQKFYIGNKIIDYNGKWISKINGRRIYGVDGDIPITEISGIEVNINGEKIEVSKVLYEDLFECNNNFRITRNKNDYFVSQWNSDGAGGFLIVWVINKDGVNQRLIWIP